MSEQTDTLEAVIAELERRVGDLPKVARESGISYDTVLRIKNREGDPGYSRVTKLHRYLFGPAVPPAPDAPPAPSSPKRLPAETEAPAASEPGRRTRPEPAPAASKTLHDMRNDEAVRELERAVTGERRGKKDGR